MGAWCPVFVSVRVQKPHKGFSAGSSFQNEDGKRFDFYGNVVRMIYVAHHSLVLEEALINGRPQTGRLHTAMSI